ncbi:MAG: hypothetical protein IIB16_10000, partial [Chloroflexi bacterium]|nr:hypothetical protein [Chloroflexota bacterium]
MRSREEWFKLTDNFISDEVVQLYKDNADVFMPCDGLTMSPFVKDYLVGSMGVHAEYRMPLRNHESHKLRAVFQKAPSSEPHFTKADRRGRLNTCLSETRCGENWCSVLVPIPQPIQNPERVLLGIPSVVRLELLNESVSLGGESIEGLVTLAREVPRLLGNREINTTSGFGAACLAKLPHSVIHDRTKIMDAISKIEPQTAGDLLDSLHTILDLCIASMRFYLGNNLIWFTINEPFDSLIEIRDVSSCTPEAKP